MWHVACGMWHVAGGCCVVALLRLLAGDVFEGCFDANTHTACVPCEHTHLGMRNSHE
jgi:hypothetical protein